jgi:hypothetical protein
MLIMSRDAMFLILEVSRSADHEKANREERRWTFRIE